MAEGPGRGGRGEQARRPGWGPRSESDTRPPRLPCVGAWLCPGLAAAQGKEGQREAAGGRGGRRTEALEPGSRPWVQVRTRCTGRGRVGRGLSQPPVPCFRFACRVRLGAPGAASPWGEGPSLPAVVSFPVSHPLTLLACSLWLASVGAQPSGHALVAPLLPAALPRGPLPFPCPLPGLPLLLLSARLLLGTFPPGRQPGTPRRAPLTAWNQHAARPSHSAPPASIWSSGFCLLAGPSAPLLLRKAAAGGAGLVWLARAACPGPAQRAV